MHNCVYKFVITIDKMYCRCLQTLQMCLFYPLLRHLVPIDGIVTTIDDDFKAKSKLPIGVVSLISTCKSSSSMSESKNYICNVDCKIGEIDTPHLLSYNFKHPVPNQWFAIFNKEKSSI